MAVNSQPEQDGTKENEMAVYEKCWSDAKRRAYSDTSKTQTEHYYDLLVERKDSPCTEEEQGNNEDE